MIEIRALEATEESLWKSALAQLPGATFCHDWRWRAFYAAAFPRFTPHYLIAFDGADILGALPLVHVVRKPLPSALISSPLCVYGGSIAQTTTVHRALADAAFQLGQKLGVSYVELRDEDIRREGWVQQEGFFTFRRALPETADETLTSIRTKQRAEVRKGINNGLIVEYDRDVSRFFEVYTESVRNLGSPAFREQTYQQLLDTFGDNAEVMHAVKDGNVVSTVLNFYSDDSVLMYYGGAKPEARDLRSTQYLYWQVMQRAVDKGLTIFDFGRSPAGSGTYNFKSHWGFTPTPLRYHFRAVGSGSIPDLSPDNPRYQLLIKTWQRLPLSITRRVGPMAAQAIV